ncbi:hypothetical protein ACTHGU_10770 [Chitinophagaceae bacterium MMS25-I14]
MNISYKKAQKRLSVTWFIVSALLFLFVLMQSLFGKFENDDKLAWGWLMTAILPTLSLMISVFVADINGNPNDDHEVDSFYYRLCMGISAAYFILLWIVLLLEPLTSQTIIDIMKGSSLYLGPVQGLVSAAIGLFFYKKQNK